MSYENGVIPEFRGEYYFLSNYCTTPFVWRNLDFASGEQAFAYAKTFFAKQEYVGDKTRDAILAAKTPGEAKKLGRRVTIDVDEWDRRRVQYMTEIVRAKFMTGENLIGPLCNTGQKMLVEGNNWGDSFWGRIKNTEGIWVGLNTLGVILMGERGYWQRQQVCCIEHKELK